jgi:purine-binding chemotaxis protein CheW
MDIAEIRKKAKAQAEEDASVVDETSEQKSEEGASVEVGVTEPATDVAHDPVENEFVLDDPAQESAEVSAGLDQLFAATDEFALATDESYADLLKDQVDTDDATTNQYLAFHLGEEEYALDIKQISEIIKVREFTDIPRAPDFILGIISLRGVVVPVYDLQRRLNLGVSEILQTSRIVVCQLGDVSVGFLVDSINQVVKLADNELEPPPGVLSGLDREMVSWIGRFQGRMVILLNLQSVLDVEI